MFRKDEVAGKIVVEASGKALGKASDVAFGLDGTVALIVVGNDNSEIQITMDRIAGVADYIVVRRDKAENKAVASPPKMHAAPAIPPPPPVSQPMAIPVAPVATAPFCRGCGAPLKEGAKFCTKCGTPV